jgi:hypothetical protein
MLAAAPFFSRGRNPAIPTDRDEILVGSQTFEAVIVPNPISRRGALFLDAYPALVLRRLAPKRRTRP